MSDTRRRPGGLDFSQFGAGERRKREMCSAATIIDAQGRSEDRVKSAPVRCRPLPDRSKSVRVEAGGDDVVGHAGNVLPRMLTDNQGLTSDLSVAWSRPDVHHDRGAVLRDTRIMQTPNKAPEPSRRRSNLAMARPAVTDPLRGPGDPGPGDPHRSLAGPIAYRHTARRREFQGRLRVPPATVWVRGGLGCRGLIAEGSPSPIMK